MKQASFSLKKIVLTAGVAALLFAFFTILCNSDKLGTPDIYGAAEIAGTGVEANDQVAGGYPDSSSLLNNDEYFDRQWAFNYLDTEDMYESGNRGSGIIVAVLDTGIDSSHEDLQGKVIDSVNFSESGTVSDIHGHGTHIAGIIAAASNNGIGIAGVAPDCTLLNIKVADDQGFVTMQSLVGGINWAVENGANVINISLALTQSSPELDEAVKYAWEQGVLVIAAAGNTEQGTIIYPAYYDNVLAVTALDESGSLAPVSNFAGWVDAALPGMHIFSCLPDDDYGYKSGTSFATAYVSGIAALLFNNVTDTDGNGYLNDNVIEEIEIRLNNYISISN